MNNKIKQLLPTETPFYFYDLSLLEENYNKLQEALSSRFQIFYSMKSNPNPAILKKLKSLNSLIDISSLGEMERAFEAGFSGRQMSFVGPGKSLEELKQCIVRGIEYTIIESLQELKSFATLAKENKKTPKFCIRVNPDKYIQPSGQVKQNAPSHFGFDESEILLLKEFLEENKQIKFSGLHFYLQSQYFNSDYITQNFQIFVESALKYQDYFNLKFEMVDFGGGFGIPYFQGQESLDLDQLKKNIHYFLNDEKTKQLKDCLFFVESGRFISGPSGFFVTKVLYTKKSHGKSIAVCDGGMTQHQAAIGIGQVIRRNFPMQVIQMNKIDSTMEKVTIAGPSCYSIDILASDIELPKLSPGDYIVVGQSGAYGPSFSPEKFLSRPGAYEYTDDK